MNRKVFHLIACLAFGLTMIPGISLAGGGTVTIPQSYDFEDFTNGYNWIEQNGWTNGHEQDITSVTNLVYTNDYSAFGGAPIPGSDHTNVLYYETATGSGGIANQYDPDNSDNVYIDVMLKMGAVEEPETSTLIQNATNVANKLALYVDTNGYLNIWRRWLEEDYTPHNDWLKLDNTPLGSDDWVRVTIALDNVSDIDLGYKFFRIRINNGPWFTNGQAYQITYNTDDWMSGVYFDTYGTNGTWFLQTSQNNDYLTSVNFDGRGMVDDLVVAQGSPSEPAGDTPSIVITNANPTIVDNAVTTSDIGVTNVNVVGDMSWTNLLTGIGDVFAQSNQFIISAIALNVGSNYIVVSGTNASGTVATDMVNIIRQPLVSGDSDVDGMPDSWEMNFFGDLDETATGDFDNDGATNFEELCAGTDPTDPASIFKIVEKGRENGSNYVKYIGGTNAFPEVPYRLDSTTNFVDWVPTGDTQARNPGTNILYTPIIVDPAYYYRLAAPTN